MQGPLDLDAMNRVSAEVLGLHDFRAFCRRPTNSDADEPLLRRVIDARWERLDDDVVLTPDQSPTLEVHDSRRVVLPQHGALSDVGAGARRPGEVARDRHRRATSRVSVATTCRPRRRPAAWRWSASATTRTATSLVRLSRMTTTPLTSGFDRSDLSTIVRAQDDLYEYVNGNWIEHTTMPEDKARYGTFDILHDVSDGDPRDPRGVTSSPRGSEARKVGDLYSSFLDEERINTLGATPLFDRLAQVERSRPSPNWCR